jgi:diguanylate cyclase (GGDEF)-like protein
MLMVTKAVSDPENRRMLVKKMNDTKGVESVRIMRTPQVQAQYGTGLPSEQIVDDLDRQAILTKAPVFQFLDDADGHSRFRAVIPFIAGVNKKGTNCLSCHAVEEGSVSGAASIILNMDEAEARINRIKAFVWIIDVIFGIVLFGAILWKRAHGRIEFLANYDSVTGLPNRNLLQDRLNNALSYQTGLNKRNTKGGKVAVLFIDLDNFKNVNDSLGHHIGDVLLQEFAIGLEACVRSTDTVSRTGGDEFVIVLPGIDREESVIFSVEKIYKLLAKPLLVEGHELFVSASIGIAMYPDDGMDKTTLMKNADAAMYRAKRAGKGRYQFYSSTMNDRAHTLLTTENELHHAIERNELVLHYQPQLDTVTGVTLGVEALVRWKHPVNGIMAPATFIPIAEEARMIVPIGNWILQEACRQAAEWHKQGITVSMSINLSMSQIEEPGFAQAVDAALASTGVDPSTIVFELTEYVLAHNPDLIHTVFGPLRERGVQLSIDDFGTGYSSLNYLMHLPVDSIKIDKSFIDNIVVNNDNVAIVKAIVGLAHSLRMSVVAEGVETSEQFETLRAINCDEVQGYLFSHPIEASHMTQLLLEHNNTKRREPRRTQ